MVQVAVMGSGSWGTCIAKVFADAGNTVTLWARRKSVADTIRATHHNPEYLPEIELPPTVDATTDAAVALREADIVVLAVPSQTLRHNLAEWTALVPDAAVLLSLAKGIEAKSLKRMSEVIAEVTGFSPDRIAVLSGPNLAKEIAAEQPAATVIACSDHEQAKRVQSALATAYFRPYTNTDVAGCELGGACKNVIALACGFAAGMHLGANTMASLMTRGLAEITRLGQAVGAEPLTFAGLAGLGDLVATCSSPLSRNRTFGYRMGQGDSVAEAEAANHGQVAEGVASSRSVFLLASKLGVEMPITEAVYSVCHQGAGVPDMVGALMGRRKKAE